MGQGSSNHSSSDCSIDILTDDAWVMIFSFLSLYERLMMLRVSKRCNRLLSSRQSWTEIDFWQEHQVKMRIGKKSKKWMFPANHHAVLAFLQKYTSGSLKAIYLRVVHVDILTYISHNCPNLKIISFCSANTPCELADISEVIFRPEVFPLPQSIEVCQLVMKLYHSYYNMDETIEIDGKDDMACNVSENLLARLGTCERLRCLNLHDICLTPTGIESLSANHSQELGVLSLLKVHFLGGMLHQSSHINIALSSLFKFTKLTSFRLSTDNPANSEAWFDIDQFLRAIGKWQNLKCLGLAGIKAPSRDAFVLMASGLPQLQTLELEGEIISDENLDLIARNLQNLTSLELTNGGYTRMGIKALSSHPSVERLFSVGAPSVRSFTTVAFSSV